MEKTTLIGSALLVLKFLVGMIGAAYIMAIVMLIIHSQETQREILAAKQQEIERLEAQLKMAKREFF